MFFLYISFCGDSEPGINDARSATLQMIKIPGLTLDVGMVRAVN